MYFVPWFYSKRRGGARPQFTNIYGNRAVWNTRTGHELTEKIPTLFGRAIKVLDTPALVEAHLGIDAKIATMVLDAVRALDFHEVEKVLKHIRTHSLFHSNSTTANVERLARIVGAAHPAHGRESTGMASVRPGGGSYSSRLQAFASTGRLAPPRYRAKAEKVIDQLVAAGELVVKRNGSYYIPGTVKPRLSPKPVPNLGYLSSSASNVARRSPTTRPVAVRELWNRYAQLNRMFSSANAVTKYPREVVRWWQDRKSTRLNSSHRCISYAVFCLKKKKHATTVRCDQYERSY